MGTTSGHCALPPSIPFTPVFPEQTISPIYSVPHRVYCHLAPVKPLHILGPFNCSRRQRAVDGPNTIETIAPIRSILHPELSTGHSPWAAALGEGGQWEGETTIAGPLFRFRFRSIVLGTSKCPVTEGALPYAPWCITPTPVRLLVQQVRGAPTGLSPAAGVHGRGQYEDLAGNVHHPNTRETMAGGMIRRQGGCFGTPGLTSFRSGCTIRPTPGW